MKTIGIDIGTTTVSMAVMDMESRDVTEVRTIANGSFIESEKEWERIQHTDLLIRKAVVTLDDVLEKYDDVAAIGLTGQMHGIVYTDAQGHAISPLYTWQDGRGNLPDENGITLVQRLCKEYPITVSTGYGLVTHIYNAAHGLVPEGAASLCTIGDYLGMALTGRKRPLIHTGNAASLGFFDIQAMQFLTDILEKEDVDLSLLPEVTEEVSVLGYYRGIPVTVCLGDNQAGFLASVGHSKGTVLLNMGTGGQISALSDSFYEAPGIECRPFLKGSYLLVGASLCGGRAYAILEHFLRSYVIAAGGPDTGQYDTMSRLAEMGAEKNGGMKVSTTFNGTRSDPGMTGSITNLTEDNFTPEGMVYGVLHGMAEELFEMYRRISAGTDIRAEHLVASGNGLRKNAVLQQIFSRMFQADLTLAPYREEAACGAALSSMMIF